MKSIARVEELDGRIKEKSKGALWQRSTRRSMSTGVGMVHKRSNSDICAVQKVWREGVSCGRK